MSWYVAYLLMHASPLASCTHPSDRSCSIYRQPPCTCWPWHCPLAPGCTLWWSCLCTPGASLCNGRLTVPPPLPPLVPPACVRCTSCAPPQDNLRYEGDVLNDKLIKLRSTRQDLEAELFALKDKRIKLLEVIQHLEDEEMALVGEVGAGAGGPVLLPLL